MATSTLAKGVAGALTAAAFCVSQAGHVNATVLTITDTATPSGGTEEQVMFTATATESFVKVQGYQVPDLENVTNNSVTLEGGGPNLLGSTWNYAFAALGSNSSTYNDGTSVPGLTFGAQDPPDVDSFWQFFATTPGDTYVYSFLYTNNTGGKGVSPSELVVTASTVPEASTWAMLLLGFAGLGFVSYRARRAAASIA